MKNLLYFFISIFILINACGPEKPKAGDEHESMNEAAAKKVEEKLKGNDGKGIGQVTSVTLENPLDQERIKRGKDIYEMKCLACHKLDDKRVVGPGWADITKKRKPEWIMNMITNVDVMLDEDEEAQKLLELCLMRMPNQNVSIGDARDILEFMRKNDGEQ